MAASVAYLVLTSGKYHETRVRAVMETWGAAAADRLLFLSDEIDPNFPQVLNLGVGSDYESAARKAIAGLRDIAQARFPDVDWIFMCDDDTFVFVEQLEEVLSEQDPSQNICFGQLLQLSPELPEFLYPSGGAGFALSRLTLTMLQPLLADCKILHWSDVTIGLCLTQIGASLIDLPGLHLSQPDQIDPARVVRASGRNRTHPLTFHWITPEQMPTLQKLKGRL